MRILVTGCAGYIGSIVTAYLLNLGDALGRADEIMGYDSLLFGGQGLLHVVDRPQFQFVKGDIRDSQKVACLLQDTDAVVHLAALVGEPACKREPEITEDVNTLATKFLVNAARGAGVKHFLFASTCSNYGKQSEPVTEESELQPLSLYATSKIEAEKFVLDAATENYTTTVLRFATAYGLSPRMRFDLLLNEFAKDAVTRGWLLVYGSESWRPFVHVCDIARLVALVLAIGRATQGVYNVGGHNRRKIDLVEKLVQIVPELEIEKKLNDGDPRDYQVDFSKAETLGFSPAFTPEDGLESVVQAVQGDFFLDFNQGRYKNA